MTMLKVKFKFSLGENVQKTKTIIAISKLKAY